MVLAPPTVQISNVYGTLTGVKSRLRLKMSVTTDDAELMGYLFAAGRHVDEYTMREFYVKDAEARVFDGPGRWIRRLVIDDLLSATEVAIDDSADNDFTQVWTAGTDYLLAPGNRLPKTSLIVQGAGRFLLPDGPQSVQITGKWGFGDGLLADPTAAVGANLTIADATTKTMVMSVVDKVHAGQTVQIIDAVNGDEDVFIEVVTEGSVNVIVGRGMNGTTAVAHTSAIAARIYLYPGDIIGAAEAIAEKFWNLKGKAGLKGETIGKYKWEAMAPGGASADPSVLQAVAEMAPILNNYRRIRY